MKSEYAANRILLGYLMESGMQAMTATARAAKSSKYGTEDRARNWVG